MSAEDPKPSVDALLKNTNQRTPCALVLDISASMNTRHGSQRCIDALNGGLKTLESSLKGDPTAKVRVQIAIVAVGGPHSEAKVVQDWTDAKDFKAPSLSASGKTPLAEGLLLALEMVEEQKRAYKSRGISNYRPWIMVITDGAATDTEEVWRQAATAYREAETAKRCVIYPIGVEGVNATKLQEICSRPVSFLQDVKFPELFQWLSASLQAASRNEEPWENQEPARGDWDAVGHR